MWQYCKMSGMCTTWNQAIQCVTFSYSDVFISIVYSLNDSRFSFWKLSIKRFLSDPRLLYVYILTLLTIQDWHFSSGSQKPWQMLSPKPLSHSIQQWMLSYIYKRKRKNFFLLLLLFFSPFLYLRDMCHYIVLLKMSNRQPHFLGRQKIIFVLQIQNTNIK